MTNEELDRARGAEAYRLWESAESRVGETTRAMVAARLARENWTPPEPVDPDLLAWRRWAAGEWPLHSKTILAGKWDCGGMAKAYLAGARMAREQEQERAKVLVDYMEVAAPYDRQTRYVLAKYRGEA